MNTLSPPSASSEYQDELFQLFGAALNGQISEEQHQKLQRILKEDGSARQLWFEFNDVECGLSELRLSPALECRDLIPMEAAENIFPQNEGDFSAHEALQEAGKWQALPRWVPLAAAAAVALGFGVHQSIEAIRKNTTAAPEIAQFGVMREPLWASPEHQFRSGEAIELGQTLELFSGSVDVRFGSGAEVTLLAPCIFQVTSANSGFLTLGQVKARVASAKARGFSVQTPTTSVVDVGTDFVASAEADGKSWIEAISGDLEVHLAGVAQPQQLSEGNTLAVESGEPRVMIRVEKGDGTPDFRFASIEPPSDELFIGPVGRVTSVRVLDGHKPGAGAPLPGLGSDPFSASGEAPVLAAAVRQMTETGQILVDLGQEVSVNKINTYSWSPGVASALGVLPAAQKYVLYGYPDGGVPRTDGVLDDQGWDLIGRVDSEMTGGANPLPEQQVSSISAASGTIGRYRYLLWSVQSMPDGVKLADLSAIYSEFDVYAAQ